MLTQGQLLEDVGIALNDRLWARNGTAENRPGADCPLSGRRARKAELQQATQNRSLSLHCDQIESGLADMLSKLYIFVESNDNSVVFDEFSMPSSAWLCASRYYCYTAERYDPDIKRLEAQHGI